MVTSMLTQHSCNLKKASKIVYSKGLIINVRERKLHANFDVDNESSRGTVPRMKVPGKRLLTCPRILVIQKAFLQRFMSYELLSVIKALDFLLFFVERNFFTVKQQKLA